MFFRCSEAMSMSDKYKERLSKKSLFAHCLQKCTDRKYGKLLFQFFKYALVQRLNNNNLLKNNKQIPNI